MRRRLRAFDVSFVICVVLGSATFGCKTAAETRPSTQNDEPLLDAQKEQRDAEHAPSRPEPPPLPVATTKTSSPPRSAPPGTITQSELLAVLDISPGVFLSHVDLEPRLVGGRFAGWTVRRFFPGDARFVDAPIRPGDIVLRVNGSTCERPEQLIAVWKRLREAQPGTDSLDVEINRGGVVTAWRWPIVADGTAATR